MAGVDYEVYFTQITDENPWDSAVEFPEGFRLPEYAKHFDVTFDMKANRLCRTPFRRAKELPAGAGIRLFKSVKE